MSAAAHRFSNDLRYRDGDAPEQTQFTPAYVLGPVRKALGGQIGLDPCTTPDNPCWAVDFYTVDSDGLKRPWSGDPGSRFVPWWPSIYCNPPYGKAREPWVKRCMSAGKRGQKVVLLIPAATDTRIFQEALKSADGCVFIRGRVKFGVLRPNRRQVAASHPSVLIGWNVDLSPCAHLGLLAAAGLVDHRSPR